VDKSGSWYSYKGDKIGQGKENVRNFLKENPDVATEIEGSIRASVFPSTEAVDAAGEDGLEEALQS
jgi:recombination protein RecA